MWKRTMKAVLLVASSMVAIPYALAVLSNMLYGWPRDKHKYRRALHPRKVYALNYVLLQELGKVRFAGLWMRWKYFYSQASDSRICKNLAFGSHDNALDLYFPQDSSGAAVGGFKPVIIFVYGGTWSSGDKSMYGLLCSRLADRTRSLVCCPNVSAYPRGYVDDMVQDVVDCVNWVYHNSHEYGGDGEHIMLMGHSSGGHLCTMAVLEMTMKRLLHHPEAMEVSDSAAISRQSSVFTESMQFEERHFDGSNAGSTSGGDSANGSGENDATEKLGASATGSFIVLDDKEKDEKPQSKLSTESFYVVGDSNGEQAEVASNEEEKETERAAADEASSLEHPLQLPEETPHKPEESDEEKAENDDTENAEEGDGLVEPTVSIVEPLELSGIEPLPDDSFGLTRSQRELKDVLSSIKLVIGLAGVYNIAEHYEFEAGRGVEDVSAMHKAMYGPEHFDRFSPTFVVKNFPPNTWVPTIHLIHGKKDKTVPHSSSTKFGEVLFNMGSKTAHVTLIPDLGHAEIVLDLMDPERHWHEPVMSEILRAIQRHIHV